MKLLEFSVQNYRGINDSGWIKTADLTTIVGKNESGKTSLLKALWKLKPHGKEPYKLDREWPRGRRNERGLDKTVVQARFSFTDEQLDEIHAIDPIYANATGVQVTKTYDGTFSFLLLPEHITTQTWAQNLIKEAIKAIPKVTSTNHATAWTEKINSAVTLIKDSKADTAKAAIQSLKKTLVSPVEGTDLPHDIEAFKALNHYVDEVQKRFSSPTPYVMMDDLVEDWIPTFIYMDDHQIFEGTAQLNQIKQRKDQGHLTDADKSIIMIMEMAGLKLDEEVQKATNTDREQRVLDMNDASATLTTLIANRWNQKKYEVMFQADGNHFLTFVKDVGSRTLVPLEERSKGFQWFFSFDMKFMYETDGTFENSIILLDEPGLHLHAEAQRDLLKRFKNYAEKNQLIYTTHLPFMIDSTRFDNIWVAEETAAGAKFHQNWESADKDARFTLQAALGMSWSQSLFVGQHNLVVEGITDFWILSAVSNLFHTGGRVGLSEKFVITSAGGATKAAYLGTLLHGQKLDVAVVLDSDSEGKAAQQQIVNNWIMKDENVLMLGNVIESKKPTALEDLFGNDFYVSKANQTYAAELKGKALAIKEDGRSIVERITEAMTEQGIQFNKGRVAKCIIGDLAKMNVSDLDKTTLENFSKVFTAANKVMSKWTGEVFTDDLSQAPSKTKVVKTKAAIQAANLN